MCGRYTIMTGQEYRELEEIVRQAETKLQGETMKTGEIFPADTAPILIQGHTGPNACPAVWGFPRFQGKGVFINARCETALEKSTFRNSLLTRRCVVPSAGFYEWTQDRIKQKFLFTLPDEPVLYMAGLYKEYGGQRRYVILTTAANPSVSPIHHRMPVILPSHRKDDWIQNFPTALSLLQHSPPVLAKQAV